MLRFCFVLFTFLFSTLALQASSPFQYSLDGNYRFQTHYDPKKGSLTVFVGMLKVKGWVQIFKLNLPNYLSSTQFSLGKEYDKEKHVTVWFLDVIKLKGTSWRYRLCYELEGIYRIHRTVERTKFLFEERSVRWDSWRPREVIELPEVSSFDLAYEEGNLIFKAQSPTGPLEPVLLVKAGEVQQKKHFIENYAQPLGPLFGDRIYFDI